MPITLPSRVSEDGPHVLVTGGQPHGLPAGDLHGEDRLLRADAGKLGDRVEALAHELHERKLVFRHECQRRGRGCRL
jgi:hypothetical protein